MSDPWAERLSEYLDGELDAEGRSALEQHLVGCGDCAALLEQLRAVIARAASLEDRPPAGDLWPGIAARIAQTRPSESEPDRARGRARRFTFSLTQLVAAAASLALLSGSAVWWLLTSGSSRSDQFAAPAAALVQPASKSFKDPQYDAAVADLERALIEGRDKLQPATLRVLERNLATIDRAIAEAQRALASDPSNLYLNNHLVDARRRKLDLLRQAAAIVSESNWRA